MLNRKQEKALVRLDLTICIISILGLIVFTILLALIENETKYLVLGVMLSCIYMFMKSSTNVSEYLRK